MPRSAIVASHDAETIRLTAGANAPRLLAVDDERDMLDFIERVFRSDYRVDRATGAHQAQEMLREASYAVLITDRKMPGMSGVELIESIAKDQPDMVRVLISGFTEVPEIESLLERRCIDAYVVKPVDAQELRSVVEAARKKKSA